ncbi:hypothetical protein [Vibrio campbellii]|nr:hypothetical protein [Vibrio campbellii]AGU96128.1 hypothetical protein M892_03060 [Vibrio campbellii ATCC BAA-1116]MBT0122708.1 hypothetical protein [Vibrio campbellii]MBT0137839.1 hypothetical protein [Vibrio campbellii]MBT0142540.1 hypothetical protein [Vibrio campbellii]MBT0147192.1 hypothetical protein [Vibrio campbellii]
MRTWSLILSMTLTMLTSFQSFAAPGWSGKSKISSIYALNETQALVKLASFRNPHNCEVNSSGDIILNPLTNKTWFTILLSAHMAGKEVDIWVNASCDKTHWVGPTFATIGHVRIF